MTLDQILANAIDPALALLPAKMTSPLARRQLLAIGLQESGFQHRQQIGGPARSFWQFERGGIRGVLRHPASAACARAVCIARQVGADEWTVYGRLANDDMLGAAFARLLLWTDPRAIPDNADEAWSMYVRNWRPGKPHPEKWQENYRNATLAVMG